MDSKAMLEVDIGFPSIWGLLFWPLLQSVVRSMSSQLTSSIDGSLHAHAHLLGRWESRWEVSTWLF